MSVDIAYLRGSRTAGVPPGGALPGSALPRADRPWIPVTRGFFSFGNVGLRGLRLPFILFSLYLLVGTTAVDEEWPSVGALRPRLLLGLGALAVAGARLVTRGVSSLSLPEAERAPLAWWGAFLAVGTLATVWAFDTSLAIPAWNRHATSLLTFLLMLTLVRTRREVLLTILVLCAGNALYLARSLQEYASGRIDSQMGVTRMLGAGTSSADPNSFAATLAFSLPLMIWLATHTRRVWVKLGVAAYGLGAAFSIVQTHSRSGLVLLVAAFGYALFAIRSRALRVTVVGCVVAFGIAASARLTQNAAERYASILSSSTYKEEESTRGRIDGYVIAWRMFEERPVLGVGPGNWSAYRSKRVDGIPLLPHNLAGQVLATFGLLGAIAFVGYLASAVRALLKIARAPDAEDPAWNAATRRLAQTVLVLLAMMLLSGLAAHNLEREAWSWAPALALAAVACATEARAPSTETSP